MDETDFLAQLLDRQIEAEQALKESLELLNQFQTHHHDEDSEEDQMRGLQLILQYRLDNRSAIAALFNYQQSVWQVLGLSPMSPSQTNIERISFALGSDDLNLILSVLSRLADALLRLIDKLEKDNKNRLKKIKESREIPVLSKPKAQVSLAQLKKALDKQQQFIERINQLDNTLDEIKDTPRLKVVLDHIAALQGPISRFQQALNHGLVLSGSLYQQYNTQLQFNQQLTPVFNQINQALYQLHPEYEAPRLFKPTNTPLSENLEARAQAKRMGHFFH